jgi:hypothetical protein
MMMLFRLMVVPAVVLLLVHSKMDITPVSDLTMVARCYEPSDIVI